MYHVDVSWVVSSIGFVVLIVAVIVGIAWWLR